MARFLHHDLSRSVRRMDGCILAVFWAAGLLSGIWVFFVSGSFSSSLMRSFLFGAVSIVSLIFVTVLPFLLSAFAVFLSSRWLLFPIIFCKGFLLSFVSMGILGCFGCAGWLFRLLLCFSDICCAPLFYWYCLRCLNSREGHVHRTLLVCALCLLMGSIDCCLISPFFGDLIIL